MARRRLEKRVGAGIWGTLMEEAAEPRAGLADLGHAPAGGRHCAPDSGLPLRAPDMVCLSHLRWDFVYQRPQHLLSRWARGRRVFYVEEPRFSPGAVPLLEVIRRGPGLNVAIPHLPEGLDERSKNELLRSLLDGLCSAQRIREPVLWYYTPMALDFSGHLPAAAVVYDCMDELANFRFAPPRLRELEAELFRRADLVFTGGRSLYEAKRHCHPRVYCCPSSVDAPHFRQARQRLAAPPDQAPIPRPRLGYFGVIDERMDLRLLAEVARLRPDWQLVLLGPVCKVDPAELPRWPNIHYLGGKSYQQLPAYVGGWDVAMIPFACNDATRFISPTKTPEYLAAGRPVVSTPIRDVIRPYGRLQRVRIAGDASHFVKAAQELMEQADDSDALHEADAFLVMNSWERTWLRMDRLLQARLRDRKEAIGG